jgi:hypothetical protein
VDSAFFLVGGLSATWLAYLLLREGVDLGWGLIWFSPLYWVLLAYLVLPRLHRILTRIYLPNYFVGRARTSDGLLGDPINVALLGAEAQIHTVMRAAKWTQADAVSLASSWRIVRSTLLRRSYPEAPVSPLLLFERVQDFAYQQEVDGSPDKRHHVRLWRCPPGWLLPGGLRADWLAAGTYDDRVELSLFTLQVTHKIAENTDEERDHVVASALDADSAVTVRIIRGYSAGYHSRNGGGDDISTDGDLPILDLTAVTPLPEAPQPQPTPRHNRRPAPVLMGVAFVAVRALLMALLAVTSAEPWGWAQTTLVLIATIELAIAWQVYLGSNVARLVAMSGSTLAIAAHLVGHYANLSTVLLDHNLAGLSMDVLLIFALSSERARQYARRVRANRR